MSKRPKTDLELEFGADELPLRLLARAGDAFGLLLSEVARAYVGTGQDPADWLVHVEAGSVLLPVRSEPKSKDVAPSKVHEVSSVVAAGLATLESAAKRPDYFSDRALQYAARLAELARPSIPITVRNGIAQATLTDRLVAHVAEVLGPDDTSYGTVEGALDALNAHGCETDFYVWDARTGQRVTCHVAGELTLDDLVPALKRRVEVRGKIHSRPDGRPVRVDAEAIEIFPPDDELPSLEAVEGILAGYEADDW